MITAVSRAPSPDADLTRRADRAGRIVTCRYLRRGASGQCTAEALDPDGEILICAKHAVEVMTLIRERAGFDQ